ncbi:MAG: beta-lactamase family protein [Betaproteobacteria bacterium]|nr:beta-lactamase family protein [Betaproteobacteria bacterium]
MRSWILGLAGIISAAATAQPLPPVAPDKAGFSREGLARIDQFFAREIAANRVPGAVIAIARDGKLVHYKAYGHLNKSTGEPMPLDAIFQLASMTKIMATVGGLALNEEGRLPLKSRLDEYLPAFGKMSVGVVSGGEIKTEPAKPIYIHDLMRHTSGITYGGRGDTGVHKLYPGGSAGAAAQYNGEEFIAKLASLPLLYQPGTVWDYGFSTDVLGLVIEKVSGKRLNDHLQATVWDKVKMPDTSFVVPAEKRKRIARPLDKDPISGRDQKIAILDQPPKFDCGGSCAFATVGDYLRFGQMLLNGGVIDGKRVLSPKSVATMTSDHLGAAIKNQVPGVEPHRDGYSFGLGVAVRMHDGLAATPGSKGDYSWNGANGTAFWADPQERLVVVYGTAAPGEIRKYYREQVGALVYGAMTEMRKP